MVAIPAMIIVVMVDTASIDMLRISLGKLLGRDFDHQAVFIWHSGPSEILVVTIC